MSSVPPIHPGKPRVGRIKPDYFKKWSRLDIAKVGLSGILFVLCAGWLAGAALVKQPFVKEPIAAFSAVNQFSHFAYSPGPLSHPHGTWEYQCSACHDFFDGAASGRPSQTGPVSDQKCTKCHAGPVHHENVAPSAPATNCASCHWEHRGRDADLNRVVDHECTKCHAQIEQHVTKSTVDGKLEKVTAFRDDHPPFRSLTRGDRGRIKFSHARHMAAGLWLAEAGGQPADGANAEGDDIRLNKHAPPLQLDDLGESKEQFRQKVQKGTGKVQLDCSSCHTLDPGDDAPLAQNAIWNDQSSLLPPRQSGEYMLPISYERHCRACHSLKYYLYDNGDKAEMPHGLSVEEFKHAFAEHVIGELLRKKDAKSPIPDPPNRREPLPHEALDEFEDRADASSMSPQEIRRRAGVSLRSLLNECRLCHADVKAKPVAASDLYLFGELPTGIRWREALPEEFAAPDVNTTNPFVPTLWLEHARFDHAAHRAVDCIECHQSEADKNVDAKSSNLREDVLITDIGNCMKCHAPRKDGQGGARFDCVECHRYHGGEMREHGVGHSIRMPAEPFKKIEDFLNS